MPSLLAPHPQSIPGPNPAAASLLSPLRLQPWLPVPCFPLIACLRDKHNARGPGRGRSRVLGGGGGARRVSPRSDTRGAGGGHGGGPTSGRVMTTWPQGRAPCPVSGATQGCDTGTGGSAAHAEPRLAQPGRGGCPRKGRLVPGLGCVSGCAPRHGAGQLTGRRNPASHGAPIPGLCCGEVVGRGGRSRQGARAIPSHPAWPRGSRHPAQRRAPGAGASPSPGTGLQAGWAPAPVPSTRV